MAMQKTLFFGMLHKGRELAKRGVDKNFRRIFLCGMKCVMIQHLEEIKIADRMIDYWKCQNAGAIDYRG